MLAEQQSGNCSSINWEEMKQRLIAIKQQWWPANQSLWHRAQTTLDMAVRGQTCPRRRIMELAAMGARLLPPIRATPVSGGVNHSRDLDLDWQSVSVH